MTDEDGFADRMNGMPKYVASTTLDTAEWNNSTLIKQNVADELTRLEQQPGGDILIAGRADLVNSLMHDGPIDEYRQMVDPIVVGSSKRLFDEGLTTTLKLVNTKTFETGVVVLTYQPAGQDGAGYGTPGSVARGRTIALHEVAWARPRVARRFGA